MRSTVQDFAITSQKRMSEDLRGMSYLHRKCSCGRANRQLVKFVWVFLLTVIMSVATLTFGASQYAYAADDDAAEPEITEAQSAILEDDQGNVLWSKDPDRKMGMASITKVMTAMVALDSGIDLDQPCNIVSVDLEEGSVLANYSTSEHPTLRELIQVLLVHSANDVAYNIAINVAGSQEAFADLMNKKAAEIGMTNTHFSNPHGLDADDHYSTARDLALMARYARQHYPFIASTVHMTSVTAVVNGEEVTWPSTDKLLRTYPGMLGIKTGSEDSGTAFLGAARRNGVTLYSCVLGCTTDAGRFADTRIMFNWGYAHFRRISVANASTVTAIHPYQDNFLMSAAVRPQASLTVLAWPGAGDLSYTITNLQSGYPVANGQLVGQATWAQGDRNAGSVLYQATLTLHTVPAYNIFDLASVAPYLYTAN